MIKNLLFSKPEAK
jgi:hypothetical protein